MLAISYYYSAHYGQSTGPIWLNRLDCTGSENNLLDCNRAVDIGSTYGCSHREDVSIVCPGIYGWINYFDVNLLCFFVANSCSSGSVRLTDGLIPTEGTVEVCSNGAWNSVCDSNWGYQEAFVVCRQLGLPATGTVNCYDLMRFKHYAQMHNLFLFLILLDMDMEYQHCTTGDALGMSQV